MHAVLVAGGIPGPDDPLFHETGGRPKALLDLNGMPMAQWVLDALDGSSTIESTFVVGLEANSGLSSRKPLAFVTDRHGLLANSKAGLAAAAARYPAASHVLVLSADIPSLTPEIVDARIRSASLEADLDYIAIERRIMEGRFPGSRRTYLKLRNAEVCGGDMNVVRVDLATEDRLWERLLAARKSVFRQAAVLGWGTLFLLLVRALDLQSATQRVSRRLGLRGRAHLFPHAEAGMDVDKPHQLAILRQELRRGARQL